MREEVFWFIVAFQRNDDETENGIDKAVGGEGHQRHSPGDADGFVGLGPALGFGKDWRLEVGWVLEGTAVYLNNALPTALHYHLSLEPNWETRAGSIKGRLGGAQVSHDIRRDGNGWLLNEERQGGLEGVVDLDFGFTPATNYAQLRRMDLRVGEKNEIKVAWMDVDSVSLKPLPQFYERMSEDAYDYNSPQGPYRATLELQPTGFVRLYPKLWQADFDGSSPHTHQRTTG